MAFSRNSLAAAVAGTLSLAVLTGCPAAAPTGTTPTTAPTSGTGASTAPTTAPGESAAPTTAPGASVAPSAVPSASLLEKTTVRGKVYDLDRATVSSGGKVTVKSLNPSNPFESTVDVISGSYVVNGVPAGVQLEISATKAGWTSRTRVETLLPLTSTQANIVNFGSAAAGGDDEDKEGEAYFIAKYPEITAVEPADEAENVDPTKLTVKLTLSEALDSTNQRRFANAIRVFPTNKYAAPDSESLADVTSVKGLVDTYATFTDEDYTFDNDNLYFVKEGSIFLDDDATRATVAWDAEGKVATLTFNAPLITADGDSAEYGIGLFAQSDDIEDSEGNGLGTVNGTSFGVSGTDALIPNVFREDDLSATEGSEGLWAATHQNITTFEVAEDDTDPTLASVSVSEVGTETRINLTFSEPMAAYNGTDVGFYRASLLDPANYSFAVGEEAADLADVDLEGDFALNDDATTGDNTVVTDANLTAAAAGTAMNVGKKDGTGKIKVETEFQIGVSTYATSATPTAPIYVEVSPTDPKTVRLVINSTTFFSDDVNAIKARVEGVQDPAGNAITNTQADAQVKTGNI